MKIRHLTYITWILSLFLSGCSDQDRTNVTGVCRSCKPYFVRGSWHFPQTHYEYDEVGLASWYGPGFHGKRGASGQFYNMHELTAAHKTLPLPCIVRVTNLDNNKSLDVLVHDRGPYVYEGRIIDLSYAAAKKLGMYYKGTGRVRVQTLVKESKAFSDYLKRNHKNFHDPKVRDTWVNIYNRHFSSNPVHTAPYIVEDYPVTVKKINTIKRNAAFKKTEDLRFKKFSDFQTQYLKKRNLVKKSKSIFSHKNPIVKKGNQYARNQFIKRSKNAVQKT